MPKPISLKCVIKTLTREGFVLMSQRGSHAKYRKRNGKKKTVIIKTTKKEIPYGTFQAIINQSDIDQEEFLRK
jgi:predicted RNA binding protein YcfA (HicA-like mRNA interferase family)